MRRWFVFLALAGGCVDERVAETAARLDGITVELLDPAPGMLGTPDAPIAARRATFNVRARDDRGQPWTQDLDLQLYVSFGGVKSGAVNNCGSTGEPLETLHLAGGQLLNHSIDLPSAFGPTSIWVEDLVSGAIGASSTIYFRNPYISDLATPPDLASKEATYCTPFNQKFVVIDRPQSATGKMVISSVFINAVAITDSSVPTFNSTYLFTFGRPPGRAVPGRVVSLFSGNISKFVGFTEINFPNLVLDDTIDMTALPAPAPVTVMDLTGNVPKLIGLLAAPVTTTGLICDPTESSNFNQWDKFNTFVLSGGKSCDAFGNFGVALPAKVIGGFDPVNQVGSTVTVTGMLKNNAGPTFNFWSIVVRQASDVGQ